MNPRNPSYLAAVVKGAEDAIITKTLDGIIQNWNEGAERLFGYTPVEAVGQSISMLIPLDRLNEEQEILRRLKRGERVEQYQTVRLTKAGKRVPVSVVVSPIKDATGKIVGASKIARRIVTPGGGYEDQARAYLAAIVESSNDAIISKDMNGIIQTWNRSAERLFGYSATEAIGQPISLLIPPERHNEEVHILERIRRGEQMENYETTRVRKDGRPIEVALTISPIRDTEGNIIGASKIVRDITERKEAERAIEQLNRDLQQRVDELKTLFDATPIGVVVSEDGECRNVRMNAAAARIFGVKQSQNLSVWGAGSGQLRVRAFAKGRELTPEELPMYYAVTHNVHMREVEIDIVRSDGKELTLLMYASPLHDQQGNTRGCIGIMIDITDRRYAEKELLKTERLESLGLLAGGIAHDFNNILTALFGNITLAQLAAGENDEVLAPLAQAEEAFNRARDLTQQLLTFSRGGAPIRKIASVTDLLTDTVTFLLHGSNVRTEFDIVSDLWPADIDVGQISQAINNIVINAKEAMAGNGLLRVCARNRQFKNPNPYGLRPGKYIELAFTDSGAGIAEANLPQIFDPYFTTKRSGTGLGLSSTYSIVKRHEGHIAVTSHLGVGSSFSVYLPASLASLEGSAGEEEIRTGRGRVLLMDDEEPIRKVGGALLSRLGYDVTKTTDGVETVNVYQAAMERGERFDLVILDLTVPGRMGGRECLARLRELDPQVTAVVSSGYSNDPIMSRYAEYGFQGVIAKPYRLADLSATLERLIVKA